MRARLFSPPLLPVWFFLAAIPIGASLLRLPACIASPGVKLEWMDAIFTATSAICVTGLSVYDTGSFFTPLGQGVLLALIQLGGLGIMTYTSLALYLLGHRVSLTDRIAVGQTLLRDPSFSLGRYLAAVVIGTLSLELLGAVLLFAIDTTGFSPWSALFHSVSAFCNAGFSLFSDSLMGYRTHWGVNLVLMGLIILGGLGFAVLADMGKLGRNLFKNGPMYILQGPRLLSLHSRVVLTTSGFLIAAGAAAFFLAEWANGTQEGAWDNLLLASLFQSVSCRTAGFSTMEIGGLTNLTLLVMMGLMFIGGSPGSTAGGIKTTTARALLGYLMAQFRGRRQVIVGTSALSRSTRSRAIALASLASLAVFVAVALLEVSEGGNVSHQLARGQFMETLFEAVSALGTVGLSMGKTETLSAFGKVVVAVLMFVGRIGPIWLLTALHTWQTEPRYRLPENDLPLG